MRRRADGRSRVALIILGCSPALLAHGPSADIGSTAEIDAVARWYSAEQVSVGEAVYRQSCAVCHGNEGQGNYGQPYPAQADTTIPPPLDGTGHASHHSLDDMLARIDRGSEPVMPAFGDLLTDEQRLAVVAYYQSLWPDSVFAAWSARFIE